MVMNFLDKMIITFAMLCLSSQPLLAQKSKDSEDLGKALEYFTSQKYHEALLIFQRLDKAYQLNPRFKAYIGLCYYNEWDYEMAAKYLDNAIPQLDAFAPHERSVYYYTAGESHFNMKQYEKAIPYYEKAATLCYKRERPDAYYRVAMCHMFMEQWKQAYDNYMKAEIDYTPYKAEEIVKTRLEQTKRMAKACWKNYIQNLPKDSMISKNN